MELTGNDLLFVKNVLKEYYSKYGLPEVENIDRREFAFGINSDKPTKRHLSFENIFDLIEFVKSKVPLTIHYSLAKYERPWVEDTEKKGLFERDFVLDLDLDQTFQSYQDLINYMKNKLIKLIDVMETELGIKNYEIWFSGNRGFHIYINDKEFRDLELEEKIELFLYLTLKDIDRNKFISALEHKLDIIRSEGKEILTNIEIRFLEELIKFMIQNYNLDSVKELFSKKDHKIDIIAYLKRILRYLRTNQLEAIKRIRKSWIEKLYEYVFDEIIFPIDRQILTDKSHLIRYPGSFNVKGGLLKYKISKNHILDFDPIEEASPIKEGEVYVTVKNREKWIYYNCKLPNITVGKIDAKQALILICTGGASYVRGEFYV